MADKMKRTPLGDRHGAGCTCRVCDGETEYIEKPRDAHTERSWEEFLCALGDAGLSFLPGTVEILSENGQSHTEKIVEHAPAAPQERSAYFRRCGTLLFLCYLLGSTDLHGENLIARGAEPVLVDLETLLSGIPERTDFSVRASLAWSVYRSHLLPQFEGKTDISGISGENADGRNLPFAPGEAASCADFAADTLAGFAEAYRFAMAHRPLLAEKLSLFDRCRFRVLLRPTDTYARIIEILSAAAPEQREAYADVLIRRAYALDRDPDRQRRAERVIANEKTAVLQGIIPLFYTFGDGTDLCAGESPVMEGYLRLSPVQCAKERLDALCEDDLRKQSKLIALSYEAIRPLPSAQTAPEPNWMDRIFAALEDCAVPSHPSSFVYLTSDSAGRAYFRSAEYGLYNGLSGILLCYAAFYRKSGRKTYLSRLLELYAPMREALLRGGLLPLTDLTCGLSEGVSGVIAALLHLSELTGERRFSEDAQALARRLDPSRVRLTACDILTGAGGLCLQLPKLPREIALPLAEALLPVFEENDVTLSGAAHGIAGAMLCFGALRHIFNKKSLISKIILLRNREDILYNNKLRNWVDNRSPSHPGYMSGWCSGAPGIGMTRQKLTAYVDDEEVRSLCRTDMERAAAFLRRGVSSRRETLCCGNAAQLIAASRLGVPADALFDRLSSIVRADSPGLLHLLDTADRNCGLMQGLAGIGYALAMYGDALSGEMLL